MFNKKIANVISSCKSFRCYNTRPNPWQMDRLTDIGSRTIFTEEHDIMRESVRKFYQSVSKVDIDKLCVSDE